MNSQNQKMSKAQLLEKSVEKYCEEKKNRMNFETMPWALQWHWD